MSELVLRRDGDVAVLLLEPGGRAVNTLDASLLAALAKALDALEADAGVLGIVIGSLAPHHFAAGADVKAFLGLEAPSAVGALLAEGNAFLDRLAASPKPVVAAVDGACLGGGLELALACHALLASDHPLTALGLPEVRLGLLPGLGGTQRLPERVGTFAAVDLLLSGRKVYAREARAKGLVDALVPSEGLLEAAIRFARDRAARRGPPPASPRTPSRMRRAERRPRTLARLATGALDAAPLRSLLFRYLERRVEREGKGHYPAPGHILAAVRAGRVGGHAAGNAVASRAFQELLFTPEARALIHLFFERANARKNPWQADAKPVETLAVVGAGLMGAGITQVSAEAGLGVRLKDRDAALAARGKGAAYRGSSRRIGRGRTAFERDRAYQRVLPVSSYEALADADLTVEAVLEDANLKRSELRAVEAVTPAGHVYASNTSAIPIATLAEVAARPEGVVGMHYFSPVPRMPLLEVVEAAGTATWAKATAVATGLRQGKAVIVVRDAPGFYTTRVLARYTAEALRLLEEGADVTRVDEAMVAFGFPLGPFAVLDDVGLGVATEIQGELGSAFEGRDWGASAVLPRLVAAGYAGRASGKGFYRYRRGARTRELDRRLYVDARLGKRVTVPLAEVRQRLSLSFLDEAVRCLDEGVLRSPSDGDVGAVFGLGFPPFLGGPFWWADQLGSRAIVASLRSLEGRLGPRFAPADGLLERAETGGLFHPSVR